jgi:hypothetical protein
VGESTSFNMFQLLCSVCKKIHIDAIHLDFMHSSYTDIVFTSLNIVAIIIMIDLYNFFLICNHSMTTTFIHL